MDMKQELAVVVEVRNCRELKEDGHSRDSKEGKSTRSIWKENVIEVWHVHYVITSFSFYYALSARPCGVHGKYRDRSIAITVLSSQEPDLVLGSPYTSWHFSFRRSLEIGTVIRTPQLGKL